MRQQPTRHTVVPGDTLWDIAQRTFGNPLLWENVYTLNQQTIEDEAHRHGYASSDRGHWIFPGTVLTLTQDKQKRPNPGTAARRPGPGSSAAKTALAKLQNRILDYVARNGTTYSFGNGLDATGRIVLDTDAPANVVSQLTDFSSEPANEAQAIRNVRVNRVSTRNLQSRLNDEAPFKGGGGMASSPLPTGEQIECSMGYAVEDSGGNKFMVTAGHCYENGVTVYTRTKNHTYGTVSDRRLPDKTGDLMDAELVSGKDYLGQIFTGGVNSTTTIPVVAAEGVTEGGLYCYSGATTGESCGHTVSSADWVSCAENGCVWPASVFRGGSRLPDHGDSGAPFYTLDHAGNAVIRGHVIAGNILHGFAEPWTEVAATYGVHIAPVEVPHGPVA
ncbi:LysM peptidoglycan-binding domain-containing protein [Streptomyces canus]|uniref:LysM peptidoglycan-binding domain-containing protein n=1 Tax=Streptomyces canus TaxID=58343 RepID=UPI002DD92326|nr:LysM peptidoglycan-binding domain-containing protein [Streptomyces canus]WSD92709.1 LysM peptidoglycan-binding domain-containing protein [Streptomyces canus]